MIKSLNELKGKTITMEGKANEKGNLFSSIHKKEIVEALSSMHTAQIDEEYIILPKPIKEIGEFEIPIEIGKQTGSFKLIVKAK